MEKNNPSYLCLTVFGKLLNNPNFHVINKYTIIQEIYRCNS